MSTPLPDAECDVLVIGSGAGGLATALSAAAHGQSVLIVEKASVFGGTTATSGGVMWIPANHVAKREGIEDDADTARTYLKALLGPFYDAPQIDAFLKNGPDMLRFLEERLKIPLTIEIGTPDYRSDLPGALPRGRSVHTTGLDGRLLGKDLANLRPPLIEMTLFGLQIGSGIKLDDLYAFGRRPGPTARIAALFAYNTVHSWIYGRATQLANGNALVARLWLALKELGVPVWLSSPALRLTSENGRVSGAVVNHGGAIRTIHARKGVVLASGGISQNIEERQKHYAHPAGAEQHYSLTAPGNRGDGARFAGEFGGHITRHVSDGGAWMPVSKVPRRNGDWGVFLHSLNQGKPGFIAVTRAGRRFVDESLSYHDFVRGMIAAEPSSDLKGCYLICDHTAFSKYGMGFAKPIVPLGGLLEKAYLHRAPTIRELAAKIGVDADALAQTVKTYNTHACEGRDPEFGKGGHAYGRYLGDAAHRPSPNIAPLERGPFYAVFIYPGDIGAFAGLEVSPRGEVLDGEGMPVPGLYAAGNDRASVFRGSYPGGGSLIGPAMTFGYIIGKEIGA